MLSVARIPWLGRSFTGFLGFVYLNGRYYTFSTYNRSRCSIVYPQKNALEVEMLNRRYSMKVRIPLGKEGGALLAPVDGGMERTIRERTDTEIDLQLTETGGRSLFEGTGRFCGFEMTGNTDELI